MPVQRGDVQISSTSTYRRFPLATTYGYRSSSLDRTYTSTSSSYLPSSSRPPRPTTDIRNKLSRVSKFELSSTSSLTSTRRSGEGSPVLTRYRDLTDGTELGARSRLSHRAASPGANSNHSSASSCSYDENYNPRPPRPWQTSDSSSSDYSPSPQRTRRSSSTQLEINSSGYGPSSSSSRESLDLENVTLSPTKDGPPAGLRNLGNTCFMNSVVQCLAHTQPLLDLCLHNSYLSQLNSSSPRGGELMKSFASLLKSIWRDSGGSFSPNAFRSQVARLAPRFVSYSQQDGQEFLRYLLLGLHEDINRVSGRPRGSISDIPDHLTDTVKAIESWKRYLRFDDSTIVDTFVGQLKSSLRCDSCRYDSVTFDPFWDLSLPIPKLRDSVSLRDCLNLFTKEEILDGDEKPTCSKCKEKRSCVKSFSIYKFPKILVLHLKRFSPYEKYRTKLETTVDCPHTLDLGSYTSSSSQAVYSLFAVANHTGSTFSGHYTASCRHPVTGHWHEFNDARVTKVHSDNVVTSKAYVLFYELNSPSLQSSRL